MFVQQRHVNFLDTIFGSILKKSSNEERTKTLIEYEVHMSRDINDSYDFEKLEDFIQTKYDLYKDKYELHIKVTGISF